MSVLVIAEPGCTHEGDKATMLRLLETAHACGANVWKPQWTSNPQQMCDRRHIGLDHPKRAYYEQAYGWLAWPVEWHAEFRDRCHVLGMEYAVSVYLPQDVATVDPFVEYHKISSFECGDEEIKQAHVALEHGKPILVSTGMCGEEMRHPWSTGRRWRLPLRLRYLHCVSSYPAPLSSLNLAAIRCTSDDGDPDFDGFSDHSRHLFAGAFAACAGAEIIETHYRLDHPCHPSNPDYAVAFTPAEFTQYIRNIRDAEKMLGTGVKTRQPCEEWALPYRV